MKIGLGNATLNEKTTEMNACNSDFRNLVFSKVTNELSSLSQTSVNFELSAKS